MAGDDGERILYQHEPRDQERRGGYADFSALINEASKNVEATVSRKISDHAQESRNAITALSTEVALVVQSTDRLTKMIEPIPERLSSLETEVKNQGSVNEQQWLQITEAKDAVRDTDVRVASIPNVKETVELSIAAAIAAIPNGKPSSSSFWTSSNAKYLIWFGIIIVVAIAALAGERIFLDGIPKVK